MNEETQKKYKYRVSLNYEEFKESGGLFYIKDSGNGGPFKLATGDDVTFDLDELHTEEELFNNILSGTKGLKKLVWVKDQEGELVETPKGYIAGVDPIIEEPKAETNILQTVAPKLTLKEEMLENHNGIYQMYTLVKEGTSTEGKLYHNIAGKRLDDETFDEYKIRRQFIKEFFKSKKHGTLVWPSKNLKTTKDYIQAKELFKHAKKQGDEKKVEFTEKFLKETYKEALQTNMGPLNLKKLKQLEDEEEARKNNVGAIPTT